MIETYRSTLITDTEGAPHAKMIEDNEGTWLALSDVVELARRAVNAGVAIGELYPKGTFGPQETIRDEIIQKTNDFLREEGLVK